MNLKIILISPLYRKFRRKKRGGHLLSLIPTNLLLSFWRIAHVILRHTCFRNVVISSLHKIFKNYFWEGAGKRDLFVVLHVYTFTGFFLYVPWLGIEPTTSAYWDDALTNWELPSQGSQFAQSFYLLFSLAICIRNIFTVLWHNL